MNNKKIKKFLKKTQPNSGFTLTELLTGLIMSIFVTGALGFGLYQIMSTTSRENAKTNARQDASRAVEFISDELRRAQTIEINANNATGFNNSGKKVVLALNIPELNSSQTVDTDGDGTSKTLGSDDIDTTPERVVYYLESNSGSNWQGPQVLYRYGPPINANGNYTENNWTYEALIDGIDDTIITADPCNGDTLTPPLASNPSGFYACINDTDTAAQIFLTGGIDADNIAGNDSNYTAETRAVARAKTADVNNAVAGAVSPITMRSLVADYVSNPQTSQRWTMRMDFDNNPYDSSLTNNATQWIHETGRQAQPIDINSGNDLTIYSIPVGQNDAISRGNSLSDGFNKNTNLSDFVSTGYTVSHTIKFQASASGRSDEADFYETFNGDNSSNNYNNPNVDPSGKVIVLKNDSVLDPNVTEINTTAPVASAPLYLGYDFDNDPTNGNENQSLGEFLAAEGLARLNNDGTYTIENLESDERIIAFEIGQEDNGFTTTDENGTTIPRHPGFDMQDNVLIMRHDVFEKDHNSNNNQSP